MPSFINDIIGYIITIQLDNSLSGKPESCPAIVVGYQVDSNGKFIFQCIPLMKENIKLIPHDQARYFNRPVYVEGLKDIIDFLTPNN